MSVQRGQLAVQARGAVVVQQQAHAHATIGGFVQRFEQHHAGHVAAPDVVLHVQAALGGARQHHARGEGVVGVGQRVDAGQAGVAGGDGRDGAAQRGRRRVGIERLRLAALFLRGQGAAGQQAQAENRHDQVSSQEHGPYCAEFGGAWLTGGADAGSLDGISYLRKIPNMENNPEFDHGLDMRIASRLKGLRQERGWSLDELAGRAGVSRATLSRLENAEVSPTASVLGRLCAAYGLTMSRLMLMVEDDFAPLVPESAQPVWVDASAGFRRRSVSPPAARWPGKCWPASWTPVPASNTRSRRVRIWNTIC